MPFPAKHGKPAAKDEEQEEETICLICNKPTDETDYRRALSCSFTNCPGHATEYHEDCIATHLRKNCKSAADRLTGYACPAILSNGSPCSGTVIKTHARLPSNQAKKQKRVQAAAVATQQANKEALEAKRAQTKAQQAAAVEKKKQEDRALAEKLVTQVRGPQGAAAQNGKPTQRAAAHAPVPVVNLRHRMPENQPPQQLSQQQLRANAEALRAQLKNGKVAAAPTNPGKGMFAAQKDGTIVMNPTGNVVKPAAGLTAAAVVAVVKPDVKVVKPAAAAAAVTPKEPEDFTEADFPAIPGAVFVDPPPKTPAQRSRASSVAPSSQNASRVMSRSVSAADVGNANDTAGFDDVDGNVASDDSTDSQQNDLPEEGYYLDGQFVPAGADAVPVEAKDAVVDDTDALMPVPVPVSPWDSPFDAITIPYVDQLAYTADAYYNHDVYAAADFAATSAADHVLASDPAADDYTGAVDGALCPAAVTAATGGAVNSPLGVLPTLVGNNTVFGGMTALYAGAPPGSLLGAAPASAEMHGPSPALLGLWSSPLPTVYGAATATVPATTLTLKSYNAAIAAAEAATNGAEDTELESLLALCNKPEAAFDGYSDTPTGYNPPPVVEEPIEIDSLMQLLAVN